MFYSKRKMLTRHLPGERAAGLKSPKGFARRLGIPLDRLEGLQVGVGDHYSTWIRKGKKDRTFHVPGGLLREFQARFHNTYLREIVWPKSIRAVPGSSIVDNARPHVSGKILLRLDLKDFFPSTTHGMVLKALKEKLGCSPPVASLITRLTTLHGSLPLGTSTSPGLANLCLIDLAEHVERVCLRHGCSMTIWCDDITVSGDCPQAAVEEIVRLVHKSGYSVSCRKKELVGRSRKQQVTGIVVNRVLGVGGKYLRVARNESRLARRFGVPEIRARRLRGKKAFISYVNSAQGRRLGGSVS